MRYYIWSVYAGRMEINNMFLYKLEAKNIDKALIKTQDEIEVRIFTPLLHKLFMKEEKINLKTACVRLFFLLITLGKMKIFYTCNEQGFLTHTSYVIPACVKFPFMKKGDYEIGPCYTYPVFRGKGIYPQVIRNVVLSLGNTNSTFYMIVREENISSIKGIEKAGFIKCGIVKKSKITLRYCLVK